MRRYSFVAIVALALTTDACTDGSTSVLEDVEVVSFLSSPEVSQNGRFIVAAMVDNTTGKSQRLTLKCGRFARVVAQMAGQPLTLSGSARECDEDSVARWLAPGDDFRQVDTLYAEDERGVALLPGSYAIALQPYDPDLAQRVSELAFRVVSAHATVQVVTVTTGTDFDASGYAVAISGISKNLMANDSVWLDNLPAGAHSIELSGLAANCVPEAPAYEVTASAREVARVELHVTCRFTLAGKLVFSSYREDGGLALHWRRADGLDGASLSAPPVIVNGEGGDHPSVSPDGLRLAFSVRPLWSYLDGEELYVMNADGTGKTPAGPGTQPAWSPDGSRIIFVNGGHLFVMNPDGGGVQPLNQEGEHPSFSPDGTRVVFSTDSGLRIMDMAGSNATAIGQGVVTAAEPDWSHDGQWIAFSGREEVQGLSKIFLVRPDGTDLHVRLEDAWIEPWSFQSPAWSPDDEFIAISAYTNIVVFRRDASQQVSLTASYSWESHPAYGPTFQ